MGLDIFIKTNKPIKNTHISEGLSRNFCVLIMRGDKNNFIYQLSSISNLDLTPLLEMGHYPDSEEEEIHLEICETEEEQQEVKKKFKHERELYAMDIEKMLLLLLQLDEFLKNNPNYYQKLEMTTSHFTESYFKNYSEEPEHLQNDIINSDVIKIILNENFGIDIRYIITYLQFAKIQGATRTWFSFG
jgi:hypothetical protein